ncbi:hypothetical protein CANCADRAFT_2663 [Tortispora caseinolytica NRRL Y-17796]|uniref:pH-response regulator protein palH/RIM21 n=1 Tax=Tortispora caseinolytica NRRL Y-17796 TaxID=767744 RepID=A0A1E4TGR4_9ASCO|nr:hypothetical protein CANCADRAFT_2663 [Tortispora caseinolytica NRRL Y-17796]
MVRRLRDPPSQSAVQSFCAGMALPPGIIELPSTTITIGPSGTLVAECTSTSSAGFRDIAEEINSDPFYASAIPVAYALSGMTVLAWILFLLLLVTPRRRPWLQQFVSLFTAVSLSVAVAMSSSILEAQYAKGYLRVSELNDVIGDGTTISILRIVSSALIFFAQVQTLLRLFPRYRERMLIKWIGLFLIIIATTFNTLDAFLVDDSDVSFVDALPALAYLFQITISVMYAVCVFYYAFSKRRFLIYNLSILLLSMLALIAVLIPVVFFTVDLVRNYIYIWGDYVRWVGAVAATVIVWEMCDRIEKLEKKRQDDGVLGRPMYDDDDKHYDLRPKRSNSVNPDGIDSNWHMTFPMQDLDNLSLKGKVKQFGTFIMTGRRTGSPIHRQEIVRSPTLSRSEANSAPVASSAQQHSSQVEHSFSARGSPVTIDGHLSRHSESPDIEQGQPTTTRRQTIWRNIVHRYKKDDSNAADGEAMKHHVYPIKYGSNNKEGQTLTRAGMPERAASADDISRRRSPPTVQAPERAVTRGTSAVRTRPVVDDALYSHDNANPESAAPGYNDLGSSTTAGGFQPLPGFHPDDYHDDKR